MKTPERRQIEWRRRTGSGKSTPWSRCRPRRLWSRVGRTGLLHLPPEGCCFAQEAFAYAICLHLRHFNDNYDIHSGWGLVAWHDAKLSAVSATRPPTLSHKSHKGPLTNLINTYKIILLTKTDESRAANKVMNEPTMPSCFYLYHTAPPSRQI